MKARIKIIPKPKFKRQGMDFEELAINDWFIFDDRLCVKVNDNQMNGDQVAFDTLDGGHFFDMCSEYVIPVNVEIKWTKRA